MKYIADLHIHSPFSRATSKSSTLDGLFAWARVKGINIIGTGDFTHPGWFKHLKDNLVPAEPGLFQLKNEQVPPALNGIISPQIPVRFMLTAEISNIYKRHGKVRKVHNILMAPNFQAVERINSKLAAIGNIESDGRPILGLDSRNLLEILLEQTTDGILVPAHIWTPWFSVFGSKSGFDSIEECFDDLADHIFALETGLSSDPDMNRLISALDRFALISNSDCHSPAKLGREANIFQTEFSFYGMRDALKQQNNEKFLGTVEFFPEEGKYHMDGHRKCKICLDPKETRGLAGLCPVCKRPLTIGVANRVMELADREIPVYPQGNRNFKSLIPLPEVLSELQGVGPSSKAVTEEYIKVISLFGSEFNLLLDTTTEEISARYSPLLAEAISRMRQGLVHKEPGYDGEFGVIKVFKDGELKRLSGQLSLFATPREKRKNPEKPLSKKTLTCNPLPLYPQTDQERTQNPEQEEAINLEGASILVTAGPGTGKTFTLIARMVRLINSAAAPPHHFFAITFTNRAAKEMQTRLTAELGDKANDIFVGTFHAFCLEWLKKEEPELTVINNEDRMLVLKQILPAKTSTEYKQTTIAISTYLEQLAAAETPPKPAEPIKLYLAELADRHLLDLDAIIPFFVRKLHDDPNFRIQVSHRVRYLFVDEFQDVNRAQYELVSLLGCQAKIFAIGDPDQAIYGFRGSDSKFFFDFQNLSATKTVHLIRNYRSAINIIKAAGAVIRMNPRIDREELISQCQSAGQIEHQQLPTPAAEAEAIVRRIEELMAGISSFSIATGRGGETGNTELSFRDIAVLTRLGNQAAEIAGALNRRGIPCQQVGATPFFMSASLSPLYYWIKAANGSASTGEHLELLKSCSQLGKDTIKILESIPAGLHDFFDQALSRVTNEAAKKIADIREQLVLFQQNCFEKNIASSIEAVIPSLALTASEPETKRFLELSGIFGSNLDEFADHLEQNKAATIYDPRAEAVSLMTLHAAKGLEFPLVFITGLEEGVLPYVHYNQTCDLEEERRLFYVGMTRASHFLILSSSETRVVRGVTTRMSTSRFLREIPQELIKTVKHNLPARKKTTAQQLNLF